MADGHSFTKPERPPAPVVGALPDRASTVLSLIGHTPLVPLRFEPEGLTVHVKCEFLNPSGSIKDRLAKTVLVDAHVRGLLKPDSVILECASGNTGIALAMVGTALGYQVSILMSAGASEERRMIIRAGDGVPGAGGDVVVRSRRALFQHLAVCVGSVPLTAGRLGSG